MIETTTPGSPGWWLHRLIGKLADRRDRLDTLESYYLGTNGIPAQASKATREAYRRLLSMSRTNFAELVVEATRERMLPVGFRTGADGDELGDKEAWRIWQANSLDADHALIDRAALTMSTAYAIVGGVDDEIGAPLITPEDPREVITECDPARRRKVIAAAKVYTDDVEGVDRAHLFLPGLVFKAVRPTSHSLITEMGGWEWAEGTPERLPAKVVPVVPFHNRPLLGSPPQGEYEPHLAILDRINYTILNRLEAMTMQAFRQRGIKGIPTHDVDGIEIDYDDVFAADPGALWMLPDTAEMWESGLIDLTPILESVKADVRDLGAVTRTPMSYLFPDAAQGSAEGAALTREGLVFKVGDRIAQAGESYEQVMSLAFLFSGDTQRAARGDMEILWASPERFSLSERSDAAVKASAAGMPWRSVMRDIYQKSPQEIERMEAERFADALLSETLAPTVEQPADAAV